MAKYGKKDVAEEIDGSLHFVVAVRLGGPVMAVH